MPGLPQDPYAAMRIFAASLDEMAGKLAALQAIHASGPTLTADRLKIAREKLPSLLPSPLTALPENSPRSHAIAYLDRLAKDLESQA